MSLLEEIPYCDIFHPTAEEFSNFAAYVEKCVKHAKSGMIKVIPPKGYTARRTGYANLALTVPNPIEQIISGSNGFYELLLLQKESMTLNKFNKEVKALDRISDNKKPVEVEKLFWKTLKMSSPLYGADAPGSLFEPGAKWNLAELDTILKHGLDQGIQGVTSPYLYFGGWKSLFAWHKEDLDLYSINYLHWGKPKFWYCIPASEGHKLEQLIAEHFPERARSCHEFMRHKTFLVSPEIIRSNNIKIHKCLQEEGEFVIPLAGAYHCGFNFGMNCAEAVNFALSDWIDFGKKAGVCKCKSDNVIINMNAFEENLKNEQKTKISYENEILKKKRQRKENKKSNKKKEKTKQNVQKTQKSKKFNRIISNLIR